MEEGYRGKEKGDNAGKLALIGVAGVVIWLLMRKNEPKETVYTTTTTTTTPVSNVASNNVVSVPVTNSGMLRNDLGRCMESKSGVPWLSLDKLTGKQLQEYAKSCGVSNAPEYEARNIYLYVMQLQRDGFVR